MKCHIIGRKYSISSFLLMVRDIKLARNGAFDNKENKEVVLGPEQEDLVSRHHEESSSALTGQQTYM